MKKLLLILIFFLKTSPLYSNINIVYLDVQYIVDNSNLGKIYKNELKKTQQKNNQDIKKIEINIKDKENDFNIQKNILNDEEKQKKLDELNLMIQNYQITRNNNNKKIVNEKNKYSKKILTILNPLLTNYVEKNKIDIVLKKKDVLVGINKLDITNEILNIFNNETKNKEFQDEN